MLHSANYKEDTGRFWYEFPISHHYKTSVIPPSLLYLEACLPSDPSGFGNLFSCLASASLLPLSPTTLFSISVYAGTHSFFVPSPCFLLFAENSQSLLMHLFKVHFKYRVFINCIALQSARRRRLIMGNGFSSLLCMALQLSVCVSLMWAFCFLWPAASVLSLHLDDRWHISNSTPWGWGNNYQFGIDIKRALILHGNVVTMSKSFWGKQHPGDRSLTQALGMRMMRAAGKSGFF